MTQIKSIGLTLLRVSLRVVAWMSALALVAFLFVALLVTNLNALTPSLVKYVSARSGAEVAYDRIGLGWVDDSLVMQLSNPIVRRESKEEKFEFESDQIEVRISQSATSRENWEISKFEVLRPRVVSHNSGVSPSNGKPVGSRLNPTRAISNSIGMLALVRDINVVDGHYEFNIGQADYVEQFSGGFQIQGLSQDGTNNLSARILSNEFDDSQLSLNLLHEQLPDGSDSTDLELVVQSVELARLLSMLPKNPATARLGLSKLETQVNANVHAHLSNAGLDSLNFSVEVNDPNLAGDIPDAEEAKLIAVGNFTLENSMPSRINVDLEMESLDFAAVFRQHPAAFPPKFYKHVSSRLRSLWLTDLSATFSADAKTMFKRDGDWKLEAKGKFSNYSYKFQERWPPLEKGQGKFEVDGSKVTITGEKGLFHGHSMKHAGARIDNYLIDDPIMTVTAGIDIPITTALDLFGEDGIVSPGTLGWIPSGTGAGEVELGINIPLRRGKEFVMYGEVDLAEVGIMTSQRIQAQDISGQLIFDRFGITKGKISGQVLGGPFTMNLSGSGKKGNFVVTGNTSGKADGSKLDEIVGEPIAQSLLGDLDWTADFKFAPQESDIKVSASLIDVVSTLPFPLRKGAGVDMPLRATVNTKNGIERSTDLSIGSLVNASVTSILNNKKWQAKSGVISVGGPTPKSEDETGVALYISLPNFNYDAWSGLIASNDEQSTLGVADSLDSVALKADELVLAGQRKLQNANITAEKTESQWDILITTDSLKGVAVYKSSDLVHEGESPLLNADLSICHLPAGQGAPPTNPTNPAELPALIFHCRDTKYGQYSLGQSTIEAEPGSDSWKITRAQFNSPTFTIQVNGDWFYNQTSKLNLKFNSVDFGSALNAFGYPEMIKRGNMEISGTLEWDAALTQWSTHRTSGEFDIQSKDGALITNSGSDIHKAVGILNYETIFRQFSNDAVNVLSEQGIVFDTISGSAHLKNGEFQVEGIFLDGPSLTMAMTGESSWNNKQHNLEAGVEPKLRKSITTLATLLINPVTGALVYAGGKLAEQVELNFKYRYEISGPWDNPVVELKSGQKPDG